jgi:membrane protease subunit (stomatin/prohibitin family)
MPVLTKLKSWKYGFESPFKVDIYYILVDDKIQQPWGTPSKIPIKDPDFGIIRIGANGYFSYKVENPETFIRTLVGTDSEFTVDECRPEIQGKIVSAFTDYFAESKITYFDAYSNMDEFSAGVAEKIKDKFVSYGLTLIDYVVKELRAPENVEKAMDDRAAVGAMGGMGMYQAKVMTDATAEAAVKMAENEGGGMGPMGMQMGAGAAMGGMMGSMMGGNMQYGQNQSNQPVQPMVQCPKCQSANPQGTKFCGNCGHNMTMPSGSSCVKCGAAMNPGAKFCPECGAKQVNACSNCGKELAEGAKFCPDCGTKQ